CLLSGISDELSYRFPLRGACLLADKWPPTESRSLLDALYKTRSKIVHEGLGLTDQKITKFVQAVVPPLEIQRFLHRAEDIVRDILKIYIVRIISDASLQAVVNARSPEKQRSSSSELLQNINNTLETRIVAGLQPTDVPRSEEAFSNESQGA